MHLGPLGQRGHPQQHLPLLQAGPVGAAGLVPPESPSHRRCQTWPAEPRHGCGRCEASCGSVCCSSTPVRWVGCEPAATPCLALHSDWEEDASGGRDHKGLQSWCSFGCLEWVTKQGWCGSVEWRSLFYILTILLLFPLLSSTGIFMGKFNNNSFVITTGPHHASQICVKVSHVMLNRLHPRT